MPALSKIADFQINTLPAYIRGKYDAVGLAQKYPEYECIKQFVQATKRVIDSSDIINTALEIDSPSSAEAVVPGQPLQTRAHKLTKRIETPLTKFRTSMVYLEDEKALQGKSDTKLLDIVQQRTVKFQRDHWNFLEESLLQFPSSPTLEPDILRGVLGYWVTPNSNVTDFSLNGGLDPVGHTAGAGGLAVADEARWGNAVAKFSKLSPDDFFDKLDRFFNQVRLQAVVPNPSIASDVPRRVIYVQEPVKRGVGRFMQGSNDDWGHDAGIYRDAVVYNSTPLTIWHAMSSVESPVRPTTGTVMLIDWNAFIYQVMAGWDQKITGPSTDINVPGEMKTVSETWHALHCVRRDRCMYMTTDNPDLQPETA